MKKTFGRNYLKQWHFEVFPHEGDFIALGRIRIRDPESEPEPDPVFFRGRIQILSKWTGSANTD
jgi:hypothetical protein